MGSSKLLLCVLALGCTGGRRETPPTRPPQVQAAKLTVRGYSHPVELGGTRAPSGRRFLQVDLTLENSGSDTPIPAGFAAFSLTTLSGSAHTADRTSLVSSPCNDTTLALRANRTCSLAFELAAEARPASLTYRLGMQSFTASFDGIVAPPMLCAEAGPEDTDAACRDNCNNDGDPYLDCNDADCCDARPGCPTGTYCGGSHLDCDCADPACCDLIVCTPETFCGQQPDPFANPISFDDAGIGSIDTSSLRAGTTPCREPALVTVDWVNDGDTIEVTGEVNGLVRMIGVDTPEIGRNGAPSDCYADEAWNYAQQLRGHRVWLTFEAECFDQFERNLAYVHFGGESPDMFQRHVLRHGYARTLSIAPNDTHEELFGLDAARAQEDRVGLWQACP